MKTPGTVPGDTQPYHPLFLKYASILQSGRCNIVQMRPLDRSEVGRLAVTRLHSSILMLDVKGS